MSDEHFFDISTIRPSRNVSSCPWNTQNEANIRQQQPYQQQQFVDNHVLNQNVNGGQNAPVPVSSELSYQEATHSEQAANIDTWDPMDDDFACPTFNSYKNFDVLNAEHPSEKSPEKSIRQSPEKRAEEISLYVGNIPLGITNEGIRNLFLSVGEVQYCKILPPKDPSNDTKYGFVRFCTWREAIKAIETYDGLYVGSEKNLQVRVAHRRRGSDDYMTMPGEGSSSDGTTQDNDINTHPPFDTSYNFDDKEMNDQDSTMSQDSTMVMDNSEGPPKEVSIINADQNLNMSPGTNIANSEQIVREKLPEEVNHSSPATSWKRFPCTNCEKLCTQRCSACKAPYCSRECQKIDRQRHKLVCTYQSNAHTTKPANPSPPAVRVLQSGYEPESDSDFDCIDISLDINRTPSKGVSKKEVESVTQSPVRNVARDSGYTSQKEDMVSNTRGDEAHISPNTEIKILPNEVVHCDVSDTRTLFENKFIAYVAAVPCANTICAVVRTPDYPRFCELTTQMAEMTEANLKNITAVTFGSLCLARFSLDNCWYRSKIMRGNANQVEVMFVDYGNTEWKNIHDLYQLPLEFWDVPPQARQFSLHGVSLPSHSDVEQGMIKFLTSLVCDKMFNVELVHCAPDCVPEVVLKGNDVQESINQQMTNYLEQIPPNVAGDHKLSDQPSAGFGMATDLRKPSETQHVNKNYQQRIPRQSHYPTTTYTTSTSPVNDPTASYFSDSVAGNDTMATYDYHNVPVTSYVPDNASANEAVAAFGAYNVPPNHPVTANLSGIPICDTVSGNSMTTSYSSPSVSYDNSPNDSNTKNNPPSHSTTTSAASDPVTSHVSNQLSSTPNMILKTHMASEVPNDSLPSTKTFGILVCHFLTPTSFWIWFLDTVKSIFSQLTSMLSETYEQSTYTDYVPVIGELIAAKYTDGVWYRANLDCINDDYTLQVTFIDFGNSESVSLYDTRRITDDLAVIPKLATKCTLYGMEEPARNWSTECIQFCSGLMLNKRGSAVVQGQVQDSLVLRVIMDIDGEMRSVVDEIVKQGYFISEKLHIHDSPGVTTNSLPNQKALSNQETSTPQHPPPDDKPPLTINEPTFHGNPPVFPDNKPICPHPSHAVSSIPKPDSPDMKPSLPYHQSALPETKPHVLSNQSFCLDKPSRPGSNPLLSSNTLVASSSNPASLASQPISSSSQSVFPDLRPPELPESKPVNPNEDLAVKPQARQVHYLTAQPALPVSATDKKPGLQAAIPSHPEKVDCNYKTLLPLPTVPTTTFDVIVRDVLSADKFYVQMIYPNLVSQLKKCVRELNKYVKNTNPARVKNVAVGTLGCAKFSSVWYRSQVTEIKDRNYRIRFIDFGNSEIVCPDEFLEAPDFFYHLAPQAICCRLGTRDHVWGKWSRNTMETLTLNKQLLCTVLGGTFWPQYAVKLQDSVNGQITDIAEELTKGMTFHPSTTSSPHSSNTASPCSMGTTSHQPTTTLSPSKRRGNIFTQKVLNPGIFASGMGEVGETYKVQITTLLHPTYFWVQHAENVENVKRFQKELDQHYNSNNYPPYKPLLYSFCVYIHNNQCLRVFVKEAIAKGLIVHSVDFGFTLRAEEKFLRPLERKFCTQPFGAVLCSMADVVPADGKLWKEEAIKYFCDKVGSNVVKVRVVFNSKARLFVDVFDPDSSDDCSLGTVLVAKGMANNFTFKFQSAEHVIDPEDDQKKPAQNESTLRIDETPAVQFSSASNNFGRKTSSDDHPMQHRADSTDGNVTGVGVKSPVNEQVPGFPSQNPCSRSNLAGQTNPGHNQSTCFNVHHDPGSSTNVTHNNIGLLRTERPQTSLSKNQGSPSSTSEVYKFNVGNNCIPIPVAIPTESTLQVFVSWIDNPDSFYVKLAVKETVQQYETMGEQLHQTCENSSASVYTAKIGDFCASKFAGEWCRCKVEALLGNGLARVFYVDFGNREDVQLVMLKPLTNEFRVLPAQALQCALADVRPQEGGCTPKVVQWLRDSIFNKILEAVVVKRVGDVLHVCVFDKLVSNTSINALITQSEI